MSGGAMMAGDHVAQVQARVGERLWLSDWVCIEQSRIDGFAAATGDHYWLHTDPERARRESPLGSTIAHGFLTMSMLAPSCLHALLDVLGADEVLNYGVENLRFLAPVLCGARVRSSIVLRSAVAKPGDRVLVGLDCSVEIEGRERPALVGQSLMLIHFSNQTGVTHAAQAA